MIRSKDGMSFSSRIQKIQTLVSQGPGDGFLVTSPQNIFWLTGFTGSFAWVLVKPQKCVFITDGRYFSQVKKSNISSFCDLVVLNQDFKESWSFHQKGIWGYESKMTFAEKKKIKSFFPSVSFRLNAPVLEKFRSEKDLEEIHLIGKAQKQVDDVLVPFLKKHLKTGISEKKLAFELEVALRKEGAYDLSFPLIVAFGENSACPHHHPTDKPLTPSTNILIDCGVIYQGYCSDMTRNFYFGVPDPSYQKNYEALRKIQEKVIARCQKGEKISSLESFCRQEMGKKEKYFTHSLGHGVGIEVHERPTISSRTPSREKLKNHQVITIEPGYYFPGKYGIRIEDLLVIKDQKPLVLSQTTKDLLCFPED